MPSGFIAKTGKLIPINDPVEMNLEMRYLMILGCILFFSQLMNSKPPRVSSRCQSFTLQKVQYSTTSRFSSSYFFLRISLNLSSYIRFFISADSSCDLNYRCLFRMTLALSLQLMTLGLCIFCSLTSQQCWKNCHSLNESTALLNLSALAMISYVRFSIFNVSIVSPSVVTMLQSDSTLKGIYFFFSSLMMTKAMLCASIVRIEGYQRPRYLDLIWHCIKSYSIIQQIRMSDKNLEAEALKLKEDGNALFKVKDYEKAIEKYSSAITLCPKISIFYSNRSRCFRELRNFERSYADAQKAVELDEKNIKAYFLMGETLVEIAVNSKDRKMIEMAIEKLKKSLRLCPSQGKSQFQERFVDEICKAKKKLWHLTSEETAQRKKALRSYLVNIVENDMTINEDEKDAVNDNISHLIEKKFNYKEKVARALICPITKAIMKDPVCNQHGNSYSKRAYIEELQRNNKKDPISGKPITTNILYSNINLKKAIESFLEKNPWAYDEIQL